MRRGWGDGDRGGAERRGCPEGAQRRWGCCQVTGEATTSVSVFGRTYLCPSRGQSASVERVERGGSRTQWRVAPARRGGDQARHTGQVGQECQGSGSEPREGWSIQETRVKHLLCASLEDDTLPRGHPELQRAGKKAGFALWVWATRARGAVGKGDRPCGYLGTVESHPCLVSLWPPLP